MAVPGQNSRRRLSTPSTQTGKPVGGVTDERQVVRYGFRGYAELLDDSVWVEDHALAAIELDDLAADHLAQVLVGSADENSFDAIIGSGHDRTGTHGVISLEGHHGPDDNSHRSDGLLEQIELRSDQGVHIRTVLVLGPEIVAKRLHHVVRGDAYVGRSVLEQSGHGPKHSPDRCDLLTRSSLMTRKGEEVAEQLICAVYEMNLHLVSLTHRYRRVRVVVSGNLDTGLFFADGGAMSDRRRRISLERQLRLVTPLIFVWALAGAALLAAGLQTRVPLRNLLLDPVALGDLPWYSGLLSNLGMLAWTIAAASAVGGAWVAQQTDRPSAARFLAAGGVVATVLLFDDLLLLHSNVLPKALGTSKTMAMLLVVMPAMVWLAVFLGEISRTRWAILVAAVASFGTSVAADQILHPRGSSALMFEDGAKFLGVLAWSLYFVLTTRDIAKSTIQAAKAKSARAATQPTDASQSRSSSLTDVLARVPASTVLTMTAQYNDGLGEPSAYGLPGSEPGTTTE